MTEDMVRLGTMRPCRRCGHENAEHVTRPLLRREVECAVCSCPGFLEPRAPLRAGDTVRVRFDHEPYPVIVHVLEPSPLGEGFYRVRVPSWPTHHQRTVLTPRDDIFDVRPTNPT